MKTFARTKQKDRLNATNWKFTIISTIIICTAIIYSSTGYAQFTILSPPCNCQVIEDIDVDNAGRILFATDDGILIYNTNQTWIHFNNSNGLTYSHIKAIKQRGNSVVFSEINKRVGTCDYISASDIVFDSSFNYNYVSALFVDSIGNTLLGTDNGYAFLRDTGGTISQLNISIPLGEVNHFAFVTNPPANNTNFYGITSSNKGVLFYLSTNQTLFIVSTATTPLPSNNIISSTYVNNVAYDGTDNGLFTVDFSNFPTAVVNTLNTSNTPLPSDTINATVVSGTSMFIGTPRGLAVLMNNTWRIFNTSNSNLPSNDIGELALHNNDLWIGTKQGHICKIDTSQIINSIHETDILGENISVILSPNNDYIILNSLFKIDGHIFLYDLNGKLVMSSIINQNENSFSAKYYPYGIYFYQVIDKNNKLLKSGKLIIRNF